MAFVGAALSMGPNVNYAVIVSSGVFHDILESLEGGRSALASGAKQMPLAAALYGAMLQRCVCVCVRFVCVCAFCVCVLCVCVCARVCIHEMNAQALLDKPTFNF